MSARQTWRDRVSFFGDLVMFVVAFAVCEIVMGIIYMTTSELK